MTKKVYRVRNWPEYTKSLVQRGNITLWFNKDNMAEWQYTGKRKPGGVQKYSSLAVKTALLIKEIFRLTYRSCQGFLQSLCKLMGNEEQSIISFTQLSRRAKELSHILKLSKVKKIKDIVIDSTGIRVYGEGEWLRKKFHKDKQSGWLKLHAAIDADSQEIVSMDISDGRSYDADHFESLINDVQGTIEKIYADGAYDKRKCYKTAYCRDAKLITPPQRTACLQKDNRNNEPDVALDDRDQAVLFIRAHEDYECGRKKWKEMTGYHTRSLVETAMFRIKSIFGDIVRNKKKENQHAQLMLRCYILNQLTNLGMPQSVRVA